MTNEWQAWSEVAWKHTGRAQYIPTDTVSVTRGYQIYVPKFLAQRFTTSYVSFHFRNGELGLCNTITRLPYGAKISYHPKRLWNIISCRPLLRFLKISPGRYKSRWEEDMLIIDVRPAPAEAV